MSQPSISTGTTAANALAAVTRTSRDLATHATPTGIHADRLVGSQRSVAEMIGAYTDALRAADDVGVDPGDLDTAIRHGIDTADHQRRLETATRALDNAFGSGQTLDITDLVAEYGDAERAAADADISTQDIGIIIETTLDTHADTTPSPPARPLRLPTAAEEARRLAALTQPTPPHTAVTPNVDPQRTVGYTPQPNPHRPVGHER